jgi:hypothetical protein
MKVCDLYNTYPALIVSSFERRESHKLEVQVIKPLTQTTTKSSSLTGVSKPETIAILQSVNKQLSIITLMPITSAVWVMQVALAANAVLLAVTSDYFSHAFGLYLWQSQHFRSSDFAPFVMPVTYPSFIIVRRGPAMTAHGSLAPINKKSYIVMVIL